MMTPEQARASLKALQRAADLVGSPTALAHALAKHLKKPKIRQAHVWNWLNRDKKVPADMAAPIEEVTAPMAQAKGEPPVMRWELRPDVHYPPQARASRAQRQAVSA